MAQSRSAESAPHAGSRKSRLAIIVGGLCVVAACVVIRYSWNAESASAQSPAATAATRAPAAAPARPPRASGADLPHRRARALGSRRNRSRRTHRLRCSGSRRVQRCAKPTTELKIVAVVNGEPIRREQLGQECLRHYGKEVLESMINKHLILQECQRRNITVSRAEVDAEIERMAKRFSLPVEAVAEDAQAGAGHQRRAVRQRHHLADAGPAQAGGRTAEGDQAGVAGGLRGAVRRRGPRRLIAVRDKAKAEKIRAAAAAKPEEFGELAKKYSEDPAPASRA